MLQLDNGIWSAMLCPLPFQVKCCIYCGHLLQYPTELFGGALAMSCFSDTMVGSAQGPVLLWFAAPAFPGLRVLTASCLCQSVVGAEGLSLAFRHIASSLLGYCSQVPCESLLHEVVVCVGYFTVSHPDNQVRDPRNSLGLLPQRGE